MKEQEEHLLKRLQSVVEKAKTDELEGELQGLHRQKLMPECLLNPDARDRVDILVGLISAELKKRREKSDG